MSELNDWCEEQGGEMTELPVGQRPDACLVNVGEDNPGADTGNAGKPTYSRVLVTRGGGAHHKYAGEGYDVMVGIGHSAQTVREVERGETSDTVFHGTPTVDMHIEDLEGFDIYQYHG